MVVINPLCYTRIADIDARVENRTRCLNRTGQILYVQLGEGEMLNSQSLQKRGGIQHYELDSVKIPHSPVSWKPV